MTSTLPASRFFSFLRLGLCALMVYAIASDCVRAQEASAQDLLDRLPASKAFETDGDILYVKAPSGTRYRVVGLTDEAQFPLLKTPAGPVALDLRDVESGALGVLDHVDALVAKAQDLGAPLKGSVLGTSLVAGPRLWAGDWLILKDSALRKVEAEANVDRIAEIRAAIAVFEKEVREWDEPLAKKAMQHLLSRVTRKETSEDDDHVTPELARRVIVNGWLASFFGETKEVSALENAVFAAVAPKPLVRFVGEGREYAVLADGFGEQRWVLKTPERLVWAANAPKPAYGGDKIPEIRVVLESTPDAEPATAPILRAAFYVGHQELSSWSKEGGFQADEKTWRRHFPNRSRRLPGAVDGFLPPHIVVPSWAGGVRLLITGHGLVHPPQVNETSAFLDQAAKSLPDAAHLDLIGEYLFSYVNDSPDSRYPTLIGYEDALGEIHQSVEQTLATSAGGICRGDCDDIAELYQSLANRQGRLAHIMNVPRHNALAFAEKKGTQWHVFVLHTGPPLEFRGAELSATLADAYRHFGAFESVDPDALPVAIRFSGENTRSQWALGWRIFLDPEYSATMIDVQRDWHFHTYRRGFDKMEKMVAGGNDDPANYLELSGLSERTNQHAEAVKYLRRALALGEDPALQTRMRLLGDLYELKDKEALAAELSIVDAKLKRLLQQRNPAILSVSQTVAAVAANLGKDGATARKVLGQYQVRFAEVQSRILKNALRENAESLADDPSAAELLGFIRQFVTIASMTIKLDRKAAFADENMRRAMEICEDWIANIAYRDPQLQRDPSLVDSVVADYYEAVLGEEAFYSLLEAVPDPEASVGKGLSGGVGGMSQLLPQIKVSPYLWAQRFLDLFSDEHETLDREKAKDFYAKTMASFDRPNISPQARDGQEDLKRSVEFTLALVEGDMKAVRRYFEWVRDEDDKRTRDGVAVTLGGSARFMTAANWKKTLAVFDEVIAYKPSYFYIAWESVDGDAPQHALIAADFAAKRFADDPAFQEEAAFMRQLLAK